MRRLVLSLVAATTLVCIPRPADAQSGNPTRYALVVQGSSGGDPFTALHRKWVNTFVTVLREKMDFDAEHLMVLTETPGQGEQIANAENVKAAIAKIGGQAKEGDLVFVMLIGHGGGEGNDSKFNLVGPDLTVVDWAALLKPIPARIAFVDSTGASFPFLKGLSGPNRVVVTAVRTPGERYDTVFPEKFIQALTSADADSDKNGRVSILEAFLYANRLVKQHYEQAGTLATEHAAFDDTGEGIARDAAVAGGAIGTAAGLTYLDAIAAPKSNDPAMQELLVRQQNLTQQVDELRRKRPTMTPAQFDAEFEKLILELSLVSRDVRRKTGGEYD